MRSNPKNRTRVSPVRSRDVVSAVVSRSTPAVPEETIPPQDARSRLVVGTAILATAGLWAYWPTLKEMVAVWNREPDYSHGWLVAPMAVIFMWLRINVFPGLSRRLAWGGAALLAVAAAARLAAGWLYVEAVDGWSILLWVGGVIWLLAGRRAFVWSLPSVGFLFFMVPWPFGLEHSLSFPLRTIATKLSCWIFQLMGFPALTEGHVVIVEDHYLGVEEACSGLRIFVGVLALAYACLVVYSRRTWWERVLILSSVLPVALAANVTRIVATGLLHLKYSSEAAQKFSHDFAGFAMIPYAGGLFVLVLVYTGWLFREERTAVAGNKPAPVA